MQSTIIIASLALDVAFVVFAVLLYLEHRKRERMARRWLRRLQRFRERLQLIS